MPYDRKSTGRDPTQGPLNQGQAQVPTYDIQVSPIHTPLAILVTLTEPAETMINSPPQECGVLVLISFCCDGLGEGVSCSCRQMSLEDCKLGQGGPFQRH